MLGLVLSHGSGAADTAPRLGHAGLSAGREGGVAHAPPPVSPSGASPESSEQRSLSEEFGDGDSVASSCKLLFKVYSCHMRNPTTWAFKNFLAFKKLSSFTFSRQSDAWS